ncbi:MAG: hypothetical protein QW260_08275 [Thermoproteota archaeon]
MIRKLKFPVIIDYFIILLFSFFIIRNTFGEGLILTHDAPMPLVIPSFSKLSFLWSHNVLTGINNMMLSSNWIPIWLFFNLLKNAGLSLWFINRTIFILPLFTLSSSFYLLLRYFGKSRVASLLSGLFLVASPIASTRLALGQTWLLVQLSGIVLFLVFFLREIKKKDSTIIGVIFLSLLTLPITTFAQPVYMYLFGFSLIVLSILLIMFNQVQVFRLIKLLTITSIFSLFLNAWWIIPTVYGYLDVKNTLLECVKHGYSQRTLTTVTSQTYLIKSFSLLSYITTPLLPFYSLTYFSIVAILIVISSVFLALRKKDSSSAFFAILFVTSVFLSQGANKPFSNLFMFLYDYFPGFFIFRDPSHFLSLEIIGISGLIGCTLDGILTEVRATNKKKKRLYFSLILVFIVFLLLVEIFPTVASGNLEGRLKPVVIPTYYYEAIRWIDSNASGTRIYIPGVPDALTWYRWSPNYMLPNVLSSVSNNVSVITRGLALTALDIPNSLMSYIFLIEDSFFKSNDNLSIKALGIINVKYIIMDDSIVSFPSKYEKNSTYLKLVKTIGTIRIYENKLFYPLFFTLHDLPNNFSLIQDTQNNVHYTIINPTEYIVRVNVSTPFYLVFTETYDKGWILEDAQGNRLNFEHLPFLGFMNCWYINRTSTTFKVRFYPQVTLNYGLTISLIFLAFSLLLLLRNLLRAKLKLK